MIRKFSVLLGVFAIFSTAAANADSGFYAGGGVGNAGVKLDFLDAGFDLPDFDEDDFAWKVMAGYNFDIIAFDLGVEAGYVDFGQPAADVLGVGLAFETTGFNLSGVAGFDLGPLGVFAKLGYVSWDIKATLEAQGLPPESVTDDGSDLTYGAGVRFGIGALEVRGEYEIYEIDETDDMSMASVSLVYYFN
jgi:hypothetical protein